MMSKQVSVPMPAIVATILSLIAGGLQVVLTGHIFAIPTRWQEMGVVMLVFFASVGIDPLVGGNAYAALKLPTWLAHLIAAILAALTTLATGVALPHLAESIILAVITVAAGMGFQPTAAAMRQAVALTPKTQEKA